MKFELGIEDLGLEEIFNLYPRKIEAMVRQSGRKAGREGVDRLKAESPRRINGKFEPKYAKNWSLRDKTVTGGNIEFVIHNKKMYSLIHLLEDGHDLIIHGVKVGRVAPIKHFERNNKKACDNFEKYIDEGLRKLN